MHKLAFLDSNKLLFVGKRAGGGLALPDGVNVQYLETTQRQKNVILAVAYPVNYYYYEGHS